jgi:hypothetical protein
VVAANGAQKQQAWARAMVGRRASKGVRGQAVAVANELVRPKLSGRGELRDPRGVGRWILAEGGVRGRNLGEEGRVGLTGRVGRSVLLRKRIFKMFETNLQSSQKSIELLEEYLGT